MGRPDRSSHHHSARRVTERLKFLRNYWYTLLFVKPVQIYGRIWFKLYRPTLRQSKRFSLRKIAGVWSLTARREHSLVGSDTFRFLNEIGQLDQIGWNGPQKGKLWRYNQHYFDDLNAIESKGRKDWHSSLLAVWVAGNPVGKGVGWESYPTSIRIVNWIKWALNGNSLPHVCLVSLLMQARWLRGRLEVHLQGNHLFVNAKALIFAGLFFDGPEASRWLDKGFAILVAQVPEQILSDGGHFERSVMYQSLILEDLLDIYNLCSAYEAELNHNQIMLLDGWRQLVQTMIVWLKAMCHPDGEISFFNDSAFAIAPSPNEIIAYAQRLGFVHGEFAPIGRLSLTESGYIRLANDSAVGLIDVGPLGPDYLLGHAHADTLSFELSVFGQRMIVNSGTSCYEVCDERLRQRGTAAHNTVVVNNENSSEVWNSFRVARRAYPTNLISDENLARVCCSHNGYKRLPGKPIHKRSWELNGETMVIRDEIEGRHQLAEARFHFHPDVIVTSKQNSDCGEVLLPNGKEVMWHVNFGEARIEKSTWHPKFGVSEPNLCLVVKLENGSGEILFSWGSSALVG